MWLEKYPRIQKHVLWASRITGLNLTYFFSNGFWVTLRFGVIAVTGFAISIAFTHFTTKEILGQYQFIIALFGLFIIFSLPGMSMAVMKAMSKGDDRSIYTAFKTTFIAGLIAVPLIIGYGLYQYLRSGNNHLFAWAIVLAGISFPVFNAPLVWIIPYSARLQFGKHAVRTIITHVVVALSVFIALFFGANIFFLVATYLAFNMLCNWYFLTEVLRTAKQGAHTLDIRYGIAASFQKFVYNLSSNLPTILISHIFGFQIVAVFYIANSFLNFFSGFIGGLTNLYLPQLFKYQIQSYRKVIIQNLVIGAMFFAGGVIGLKLFFLRLYGIEYQESLKLAYIASPILIFLPLRLFLVQLLTARGKNSAIIQGYVVANILGGGLFFAAYQYGALTSVSLYILTSHIALLLVLLYFLKKNDFFRGQAI